MDKGFEPPIKTQHFGKDKNKSVAFPFISKILWQFKYLRAKIKLGMWKTVKPQNWMKWFRENQAITFSQKPKFQFIGFKHRQLESRGLKYIYFKNICIFLYIIYIIYDMYQIWKLYLNKNYRYEYLQIGSIYNGPISNR